MICYAVIEERLKERPAQIEECAQVAEGRVSYNMQIPCPDNKPGCLVFHSVLATREKEGSEAAQEIRALAAPPSTV